MPREGVTIYDLLLSCPGDVIDLIDIVKECIEDFNRVHGKANNVKIELKHWSTDAYPQSGDSAQELLNKQFINDCDACIALFGHRFGSPTDKFESGTEQEIEEMIASGKQVFMYFIERDVNINSIDLEQLTKVRNFKDKYSAESKGIYWGIKDDIEFRRLLSNHLSLYFLELIVKPEITIQHQKTSKLEFLISKLTNKNLVNSEFLYEKKVKIKNNIELIQSIDIVDEQIQEFNIAEEAIVNEEIKNGMAFQGFVRNIGFDSIKVCIPEDEKKEVIQYCNNEKISLKETFWSLGSLKQSRRITLLPNENLIDLEGKENEKRKYELIQDLYNDIITYNNYLKFFEIIDSYSYVDCYIRNSGTTFDEDIDIKIKIPKNCVVKRSKLPIPEEGCIEEINDYELAKVIFTKAKNPDIEEYSGYSVLKSTPFIPSLGIYGESNFDKYKRDKEEYIECIERIFCYDYYEDGCNDILKFKVEYLKQNTSMYTPSILFFEKQPEYIEYEIKSKHYPNVITGKIEIEK